MNEVSDTGMSEIRKYNVTVNGYETVMNLNEQDAERLGGKPVKSESSDDKAASKSRTTSNKARSASDKGSDNGPAGDGS